MCECERCARRDDDLRWFVLLVRQGLKLIVRGIEARYRLDEPKRARDEQRAA